MIKDVELVKYAMKGLAYRKLRSWLTILGIVIGIASIVILIALAQGLDAAVRDQINSFGSNFIDIIPGSLESSGFGTYKGALYQNDADAIKRIPGILSSTAIVSPGFVTFEFKNSSLNSILAGVDPAGMYEYTKTVGFGQGKNPQSNDQSAMVIGNSIAKSGFKEEVRLGDTIYANGVPFKVKGIFNPSALMDSSIYINIQAARRFLSDTEDPNRVYEIFAVTKPGEPVAPIAAQVEKIIANNHKVSLDNKDFSVITADTILESVGAIFGLLSLFLGSIAFISIIVGAIGIANSMFTAVLERTREIGILKAVGSDNSTIIRMFLFEAGLLGAIGGIIGIIVGGMILYLIAYGIKAFANIDLVLRVSPELALFSVVISIAVGLIAGYFPAREASHMQPVEALRYE